MVLIDPVTWRSGLRQIAQSCPVKRLKIPDEVKFRIVLK